MKKQEAEPGPKEMFIIPKKPVIVGGPVAAPDTPVTMPPSFPFVSEGERLKADWADYYRSLGMHKEAEMVLGIGKPKETRVIEGQKDPAQSQTVGTPEAAESLPSLETQSPSSGARSRASSFHSSLSNEGVVEELSNLVSGGDLDVEEVVKELKDLVDDE